MLALTRKPGQSIVIDGRITIKVVWARDGQVRLGVKAPRNVPVVRDDAKDTRAPMSRGRACDQCGTPTEFGTGAQGCRGTMLFWRDESHVFCSVGCAQEWMKEKEHEKPPEGEAE